MERNVLQSGIMLSVVVPFYNEEKSVRPLHERLIRALAPVGKSSEIIFVDDGSSDGTFAAIKSLAGVRGLRLKKNYGQTAAFACGVQEARGDVVVTMDGDLENFPEDIPALLAKLEEGYDVAAGWRKTRWQKQVLSRKVPSLAANWLISRVTGVRLHDHGCNLRAYRRVVFEGVHLRGEMHRMLAAYLGMRGAKVAEVPISYAARPYGKSKYGISRTFRVMLDVLALYFFQEYASRPMHFFGYAGFVSIFIGGLTFLWALYLRVGEGIHLNRTPLPVLVGVLVVIGFQFILLGLLAEMLMRSREENATSYELGERTEH